MSTGPRGPQLGKMTVSQQKGGYQLTRPTHQGSCWGTGPTVAAWFSVTQVDSGQGDGDACGLLCGGPG